MPAPLTSNASHNQPHQTHSRLVPLNKNVKRKSSKPIINWLQRKLGGTVRARRVSNATKSIGIQTSGVESTRSGQATTLKDGAMQPRRPRDTDENGYIMHQRPLSNQISLNSTVYSGEDDERDVESTRRSSGAAVSLWGSRSNPVEADEDASIRPLPPTSPPSPSPSRSSSSYLSDPRTFKSMSASTKPTTLLSIDLTPNGMAHIAQAPPTPTSVTMQNPSPINRFPTHVRTASSGPSIGASITFSPFPTSPQASRPSSLNPIRTGALQAPQHTSHHPRNNPRPSSPPLDNASVLTLASSAFGIPTTNRGAYAWTAGADSASHLGGGDSVSHIILDGELTLEDRDASVRALRPRSSRRGSWESEVSRWSAGISALGAHGPMGRERSVRTAPSFRTGGQGTVDDQGSVSLLDDDMLTREGGDELDGLGGGTVGDEITRERTFSPMSAISFEGVPEENDSCVSKTLMTETESTSQGSRNLSTLDYNHDEVATPGPEGRTITLEDPALIPLPTEHDADLDTLPVPKVDVDSTPKKEIKIGVLENITQTSAGEEP